MAEERISVELGAAPGLRTLVLTAHVVAATVLAIALGTGFTLLAAGLLLALSASLWHARLSGNLVKSTFQLQSDRGCRWLRAGHTVAGRLRADSTALPGLIILRFDEHERRAVRTLVLTRAAMHADDWRRLQAFLRWGVRFDAAGAKPSAGRF